MIKLKKTGYIFLAAFSFLFASCKNDLVVLDNYKENMVVYGLLNPSDTVQFIKIGKTFLGDADAYQMANEYDSANYASGKIITYMERWLNGSLQQTIPLTKDSAIPKDDGVFHSPFQVLYKTNVPIVQDGSVYTIFAKNTESGHTVSSSTKIITPVFVNNPTNGTTINLYGATIYKTKWSTSKNGRTFNLTLKVHYQDVFMFDTTQVSDKFIEIRFGLIKSQSLDGGEFIEQTIPAETFYRSLGNMIPQKGNVFRRFKGIEFVYSVAAEEFTTYIDVNQTQGVTFGDKPFYTNIENGLGLFSCRLNHSVRNVKLNSDCLDSLRNGRFTKHLNFQ